jgi:hypothetical protein
LLSSFQRCSRSRALRRREDHARRRRRAIRVPRRRSSTRRPGTAPLCRRGSRGRPLALPHRERPHWGQVSGRGHLVGDGLDRRCVRCSAQSCRVTRVASSDWPGAHLRRSQPHRAPARSSARAKRSPTCGPPRRPSVLSSSLPSLTRLVPKPAQTTRPRLSACHGDPPARSRASHRQLLQRRRLPAPSAPINSTAHVTIRNMISRPTLDCPIAVRHVLTTTPSPPCQQQHQPSPAPTRFRPAATPSTTYTRVLDYPTSFPLLINHVEGG